MGHDTPNRPVRYLFIHRRCHLRPDLWIMGAVDCEVLNGNIDNRIYWRKAGPIHVVIFVVYPGRLKLHPVQDYVIMATVYATAMKEKKCVSKKGSIFDRRMCKFNSHLYRLELLNSNLVSEIGRCTKWSTHINVPVKFRNSTFPGLAKTSVYICICSYQN